MRSKPSSWAIAATAAAKVPPELSPATARTSPFQRSASPFSTAHLTTAEQSSRPAGYAASGASR